VRKLAPLVVLALTTSVLVVASQQASAAVTTAGAYVPLAQKRIVNTQVGTGVAKGAIAAQHTVTATLTGSGGVPVTASAVQVTITAFSGTANGGVTLYKPGTTHPVTTNLLFATNQIVSDTAVAQVSNGQVDIFNAATSGTVQVFLDLTGYYIGGSATQAGTYTPVVPVRIVNTTANVGHTGPVPANGSITSHPTTIPATASQVAVTVSVLTPTKAGSIVAFAGGTAPTEPTTVFKAAGRVSSFAFVPLSSAGTFVLHNASAGTVQIVVDLVGYVSGGPDPANTQPSLQPGTLQSVAPARIYSHTVAANAVVPITVKGLGGVPLNPAQIGTAQVVVQVVSPSKSGAIQVYTGTRFLSRSLSTTAGTSASNELLVQTSTTGTFTLFNATAATVTVTIDLYGFTRATAVPVPATISTGRYVRDIMSSTLTSMQAQGAADAASGATLVVLEFGAQTDDTSGVQLTVSPTRLTYAQITTAINSYLVGFGAHSTSLIAVGTNNDADSTAKTWSNMTASARGTRWAQLVNGLAKQGTPVVGANDIESGFFSTELQAQQWETAYLAAASATSSGLKLIFNGSSDGCPQTFRSTAACNFGWTLAQIYALAHNGTAIQALPQIYFQSQANQWANIDAAGGSGIVFAGVLNESAAEPLQFSPPVAFQALYISLSRLFVTPPIPSLVVNLQIDS